MYSPALGPGLDERLGGRKRSKPAVGHRGYGKFLPHPRASGGGFGGQFGAMFMQVNDGAGISRNIFHRHRDADGFVNYITDAAF